LCEQYDTYIIVWFTPGWNRFLAWQLAAIGGIKSRFVRRRVRSLKRFLSNLRLLCGKKRWQKISAVGMPTGSAFNGIHEFADG
jgi:hypothetical protein